MATTPLRIALVVNPIAGIGGAAGLKGSDGDLSARALELGARPVVAQRVRAALAELTQLATPLVWYAADEDMGAALLRETGAIPQILYRPQRPSNAMDTQRAAALAADEGVDLLLFAGGDGTARDILAAVGERLVVLGIPAGVKMHSAVFAVTPRTAGAAVRRFLEAGAPERFCARREVMDREFLDDGQPAASPNLHGYLKTLQMPSLVQAAKSTVGGGGDGAVLAALPRLAQEISGVDLAILGPGATLLALKQSLGCEGTLLGVDIFARGRCVVRDASEAQVWDAIEGQPQGEGQNASRLLALGVIGGQGFLLGRGNQQLSARVLREIAPTQIRILASAEKLAGLPQATLYVDTGDDAVDDMLAGYLPVITGPRRSTLCRIASSAEALLA
ncbi:MAG: putative polyphosphate/ATP-dependent NAD kinase [Glaciecola sp.]|jgi:predicted polyphosphate/ATP-dependent NAD kinase